MHSASNPNNYEAVVRAGFTSTPDDHALLVAALGGAPRDRVLALRGLTRRGEVTDDLWCQVLNDTDADVRREALTQLAQHHVAAVVSDVAVSLLTDDDPLVVEAAAFALGESLYVPAVPVLLEVAAHHEDARCRESAIAALGAIGDDRARAVIIGALDDKPPVRRRAIVALANFEGPDIDAALERASEDRDWQVRAAVHQLGRDEDD